MLEVLIASINYFNYSLSSISFEIFLQSIFEIKQVKYAILMNNNEKHDHHCASILHKFMKRKIGLYGFHFFGEKNAAMGQKKDWAREIFFFYFANFSVAI